MTVSLIHSTTDGDDLIAYMARVSNPANQNTKDSARLISYLIKHNHWSPFEMVNMCVSIETTRSIAAQILRHRSFSFQEFSQRYAAVTTPSVVPELRRQDTKNRQNSIDDLDGELISDYQYQINALFDQAEMLYKNMVADGIAKECAREVLPLATPTHLYMSGTLRSWIHYCNLRCGNGTQLEHKRIADACKALIRQSFPNTYAAVFTG
jgi:thymidylate synthase (FAD)